MTVQIVTDLTAVRHWMNKERISTHVQGLSHAVSVKALALIQLLFLSLFHGSIRFVCAGANAMWLERDVKAIGLL
eukprot:g29594.t1